MKTLLFLLSATVLISCGQTTKDSENNNQQEEMMPVEADGGIGDGTPSIEKAMVISVENAHNKQVFLNNDMVSFDIVLNFGGNDILNGNIKMLTDTSKIRIDKADGTSLIFDNENLYISPKDANAQGARFGVFTWPYFFGLPYKLQDDGVNVALKGAMPNMGKEMNAFKMTFDEGTGDAPDDYYVVYTNDENQIVSAGYIVTYGDTPVEKAEENAHAIVYENYEMINAVPIAKNWKFYNWNAEEGIVGKPIGNATLSNVNLGEAPDNIFEAPADSKMVE